MPPYRRGSAPRWSTHAPGWSARSIPTIWSSPKAKSESVTNYEVGLKGRWLGGDLVANIAAYYIDWKDIQVQANRVSDSIQFATNIGGAESYGLEFEFIARPVQGLSLALNGSFNRAKVTDLTPGEAAISGAELGTRLASPHFQGSGTLRYDFPIGADDTAYRSAEHTSELQSLMRISYAVFCLKTKT